MPPDPPRPPAPADVSAWMLAAGADAIATQRRFDAAFAEAFAAVRDTVEAVGAQRPDLTAALLPPHLVLDRLELELTVVVKKVLTAGAAIAIVPLNLGYAARYHRASSSASALTITVERTPVP
jgi:hypothetical protein